MRGFPRKRRTITRGSNPGGYGSSTLSTGHPPSSSSAMNGAWRRPSSRTAGPSSRRCTGRSGTSSSPRLRAKARGSMASGSPFRIRMTSRGLTSRGTARPSTRSTTPESGATRRVPCLSRCGSRQWRQDGSTGPSRSASAMTGTSRRASCSSSRQGALSPAHPAKDTFTIGPSHGSKASLLQVRSAMRR